MQNCWPERGPNPKKSLIPKFWSFLPTIYIVLTVYTMLCTHKVTITANNTSSILNNLSS